MENEEIDVVRLITDEIIGIAKRDGIITEEEQTLIDSIENEMKKYKTLMEKALEDNEITPKERNSLFRAKLQIIKNSVKTIRQDFNVSNDEQEIINGLQKMLPEISKFEKKF
ncbi:MAG: hypothetical protein IH840_03370 [Candidatus Heimdallarchaeota archaeon]|nr:hypothetical protein [Candidatus Heimdallarchaeota archaeon]